MTLLAEPYRRPLAQKAQSGYNVAMQVQVKLFSRFRKALPPETKGEAVIDLPAGTTIEGMLAHLGIGGRIKLIAVNGEKVDDPQRVLCDGDQVRIFPIVVGG